jgi:hypothetical protein
MKWIHGRATALASTSASATGWPPALSTRPRMGWPLFSRIGNGSCFASSTLRWSCGANPLALTTTTAGLGEYQAEATPSSFV